jgi:DNA-binding NarL/FixJ family response regulator
MSPIRVVLVDDHPVVRSGIRILLEKEPDISVIGETSNGNEALRLLKELKPDVLVLDMNIPGMRGYEVAQQVKKEGLHVKILALSGYTNKIYIQEALASGVTNYITKDDAPCTIVEAIRGMVHGQEGWLSRQVASQITFSLSNPEDPSFLLTPRELEILKFVTESKTNQEIALMLGVSRKTIEKHLVNIYQKLNVEGRVEAAVYAVKQGWFEKSKDAVLR